MLGKKKNPEGAPAWVMTYGDMMSLLLCFFIMLTAFADFQPGGGGSAAVVQAMQSIQKALGIKLKNDSVISQAVTFNAMLDQIKKVLEEYDSEHRGDTDQKGIQGKTFRLKRIRDGMEITIGGPILFEPFAARLTEQGRDSLVNIADILKGHRNKVDIVGHAAEQPAPADWTYSDAMQLSYDRARCVADELVRKGVDPRAVRLVAVGANEPVRKDSDQFTRSGDNRRVEIVVRESLIDDYREEQSARRTATAPAPASSDAAGAVTGTDAVGVVDAASAAGAADAAGVAGVVNAAPVAPTGR